LLASPPSGPSTGLAEVRQAFGGWSRSVVIAVGR
jgi:hypothetical protein